MSAGKVIDKVGLCVLRDGRLLLARSAGDSVFQIPGGKVEATDVDDLAALEREIREELGVAIRRGSADLLGRFSAQAAGKPGVIVTVKLYSAAFRRRAQGAIGDRRTALAAAGGAGARGCLRRCRQGDPALPARSAVIGLQHRLHLGCEFRRRDRQRAPAQLAEIERAHRQVAPIHGAGHDAFIGLCVAGPRGSGRKPELRGADSGAGIRNCRRQRRRAVSSEDRMSAMSIRWAHTILRRRQAHREARAIAQPDRLAPGKRMIGRHNRVNRLAHGDHHLHLPQPHRLEDQRHIGGEIDQRRFCCRPVPHPDIEGYRRMFRPVARDLFGQEIGQQSLAAGMATLPRRSPERSAIWLLSFSYSEA